MTRGMCVDGVTMGLGRRPGWHSDLRSVNWDLTSARAARLAHAHGKPATPRDLQHTASGFVSRFKKRKPAIAGGLSIVHPHRCPTRDFVGTSLVLVAADVEAAIVLARGAVFADVGLSPDFHDGAELDGLRAGDR